jgi:hypothetical protein
MDNTPKSICEQDSELVTDKFMGGWNLDSSFQREIGEYPGEDESPREYRVSAIPE